MRFLLRPGWLAFVAVVIGFAVACYTLLAPWQFGREAQRDAEQQAIDASYRTPPVPLADLVTSGTGVRPDVEWRQVTVTGTYVPEAEGLVRLRVVDGKPAFEVLTPLRAEDGRLVAVDRGYVTTTGGVTVPSFAPAPPGTVTLTGRLRLDETDPQNRPVQIDSGHRQLYAADSRALGAATGLTLEPGYLQLSAGQPGVLGPLAVAESTGGAPFTNFSYALQWLTFGAIAIFALGYFIRLEILQRRGRDRRGERTALRQALAGDDDDPPPAPERAAPDETPLADRYGRN
ncbi:SURF1 family protein [Pseudonocardia xinjiangensis]|uniref:SURF1-like protein n=1 Tax=Pseudonocardia xinjiangensis TaxID=75289 RepID=A0ABX1RJT4_9PSEU|nr:SURF1 family cytochrome oxidase biogenesis protein [Pseudonocardia xinjiangensis]NMH80655.1 SURF1 family protein [Pseudonocardia xinjiangensis]